MNRSVRLLFASAVLFPFCTLFTCTAGNYDATCLNPSSIEICGNLIDDDCNGIVDDGCTCTPGTQRACWPDRSGNAMAPPINMSENSGCQAGLQTCTDDGNWDIRCEGGMAPADEVCGNGIDENCDGQLDDPDACQCVSGATRDCWVIDTLGTVSPTPPASHDNAFSRCKKGTQQCANGTWTGNKCLDGSGNLVAGPQAEVLDCKDNNCDGRIDEGLVTACKNPQNSCWGFYQCNVTTLVCGIPAGLPDATGWHATANTVNGSWDWNCSGLIEFNYCPATGCAAMPPPYFINTKDPAEACAAINDSIGSCPATDVAYNLASPTLPACGAALPATKCVVSASTCIPATPTVTDNWKVFCR